MSIRYHSRYHALVLDLQILGFLDNGPLHGYEIRRRIHDLSGPGTRLSAGALYPALARLERQGLVSRTSATGARGRTKQVLALTEAGRERLHALLRDADGPDIESMPRFMTVLAFLSHLPDAGERQTVLRRRLAAMETAPAFFTDDGAPRRLSQETDPYRRGMTLTARAARTAELAWLHEQLGENATSAEGAASAQSTRHTESAAPPARTRQGPGPGPHTPASTPARPHIPVEAPWGTAPATPTTMRAAVLSAPGLEHLSVADLPLPEPGPGQVRIKVMAFGLNRSEYHCVTGQAEGMSYPRVLGIEASGVIDLDPDGVWEPGQQVVTMMGGMGRSFDGGYAQYTVVPREQVLPFACDLPWEVIGSVPETLQTAYGSLTTGLGLAGPGGRGTVLVRGGTSALGLAASALARDWGYEVLATSRRPEGLELLRSRGVSALLDDGEVAPQVRKIVPEGVVGTLELVGVPTLRDSLAATAVHGAVCFTGMLSDSWTIRDFYPMDWLPNGVRLTAYSGESSDLPAAELQRVLDRVAAGVLDLLPVHAYTLDEVAQAHRDMASGARHGKLVGLPWA